MTGQTGPRRQPRQTNSLGDYLRSLREQRGLTIRQLSIQIDRTEAYINRIELGKRGTSLLSLYKLITALGGDFRRALYYLCFDEGVPADAIKRIASGSTAQTSSRKPSSHAKSAKD